MCVYFCNDWPIFKYLYVTNFSTLCKHVHTSLHLHLYLNFFKDFQIFIFLFFFVWIFFFLQISFKYMDWFSMFTGLTTKKKVTNVTTEHQQKWSKMVLQSTKKSLFCPMGKESPGLRPLSSTVAIRRPAQRAIPLSNIDCCIFGDVIQDVNITFFPKWKILALQCIATT